MIRSLITLLLLANMSTGTLVPDTVQIQNNFNNADLLEVHLVPVKDIDEIEPVIEAVAALVMDMDSGVILYEKDIYTPLPMASLTKIMTAILILESHDLSEVVTVNGNYGAMTEDEIGVRIWLRQYEKITVGNLLTALLVPSAGDAALALAEYHSGSVEEFIREMNKKTVVLNLENTNFVNPIGLDDEQHYSSAFDLAILTKYALTFPAFRNIIRIREATVASTDGKIKHQFENTNWLLDSYLDIQGVKTGTTEAAGASLINLARDYRGHEIISVLLNSQDRFQENKSLIDWIFRSYKW
ncbi:D-alanyl-D-alanine carboxypeptidase [Patescibacteria group bacterium]|nr:D-alanyl-D-alanine carboxypeptidase [Patescibacteria group bacterium]MBU1682471.1 D-alanyl-D-alanine carboxypeptidase [Patescibacteria group bacterium]MBU1935365.1 D-alanyl-D-alanine carboxypeptidase [Patescibacteria group bacterium]